MTESSFGLQDRMNRRLFLRQSANGLGLAALSSLVNPVGAAPASTAKAKRIIYLFQSGAPSQVDLFDPKPGLEKRRGEELPASIRMGQRLTTMTSGQGKFPVAPSAFKFKQYGKSGMWFSEILPKMSALADDFCMVRSMNTEAINHDPAITFIQTGSQLPAVQASVPGSVTALVVRTRICRPTSYSLRLAAVVRMISPCTTASGARGFFLRNIRE